MMKTTLATLITTTLVIIGITGSENQTLSFASSGSVANNPGVSYQQYINSKNGGAPVPPVETDTRDDSINVSAMPARFIYVQFPGEDSKIVTLQDLGDMINQRAIQTPQVSQEESVVSPR